MRRVVIAFLFVVSAVYCFAQPVALRDYVGLINQSYHPDIVSYMEKFKARFEKDGEEDAATAVDLFLKGATGSGFVCTGRDGRSYLVTNHHVIAQAHTLSVTFEKPDGTRTKYEGLTVVAADAETDIAILAFGANRPPVRGLSLLTRAAREGETVYSAGFPGLGVVNIWQFGQGMISNALARLPRGLDENDTFGPFIQHTAQIDPGNSGGPLLVPQGDVPTGYAVVGINTLSALRRQAANYAIPATTARTFIDTALNPRPETWRAALDEELTAFVGGLGENRAVYPHIARYLSAACVGENAEFAVEEIMTKGSHTIKTGFIREWENDIVSGMGYAVAWIIETSMRNSGAIKAELKDVSGEGEAYTVNFIINGREFSSRWVREYGNWRIATFDAAASGDKTRISERETKQKNREALHGRSDFSVETGYAYLFDKEPAAVYAALDFWGFMGFQTYFANPDFYTIGAYFGWTGDFYPSDKVAVMPFIRGGMDYQVDEEFKQFSKGRRPGLPISATLQAGIKITTSYVPGLTFGAGFQYNLFSLHSFGTLHDTYDNPMEMALRFTVGYAF
ncbi:MAG: trypsin-like peptidase domain-containing protein [Treponema sp.]|jgi:serine protease Do|nr:trypsin-like peptidase domain-containing protein [Treponema sp.]